MPTRYPLITYSAEIMARTSKIVKGFHYATKGYLVFDLLPILVSSPSHIVGGVSCPARRIKRLYHAG